MGWMSRTKPAHPGAGRKMFLTCPLIEQAMGVALMFVLAFVVAISSGFRAFAIVFGCLILFVLLGHVRARGKPHRRQ